MGGACITRFCFRMQKKAMFNIRKFEIKLAYSCTNVIGIEVAKFHNFFMRFCCSDYVLDKHCK